MQLKLYYPAFPHIVNQKFGAAGACYRASDKSVVTKIEETCPSGYVDLYAASGMKGHNGEDMYGASGQKVFASHAGVVEEIETEPSRGLGIGIVSHEKYDFGDEAFAKSRYWHLKGFNVVKGQHVKVGDLIGYADNTGYSSGDHIHYELKPVLYDKKGNLYNIYQNNGFYGAIDPALYWTGYYSEYGELTSFTTNFYLGQRNAEIRKLQSFLKKHGYFTNFEITDYYGNLTRKAVLDFQMEHGVVTNGVESMYGFYFGPKSREYANKLI